MRYMRRRFIGSYNQLETIISKYLVKDCSFPARTKETGDRLSLAVKSEGTSY